VFVNARGVKRAYKLKPSDSRVLEEQALERQLNAAVSAHDQGGQGRVFAQRRGAPDADV
jgi:hypothetical protein